MSLKSSEFYKHLAWRIFTKYVLLFYSNNGAVACSTCGKWMMINSKDSCTGHLIKVFDGNRTNFSTSFEFNNCLPQCQQCNRYGGGKPDIMYRKLVEIHGQDAIDKLYLKKNFPLKLDTFTLEMIYKEYKDKYDKLKVLK
jgi:hypothetical protein